MAGYDRKGFLPSRTFDLIASGRAILANTHPDGELARLLDAYGNACCVTGDQIDEAAEYVRELLSVFRLNAYQYSPLSAFARQYSSSALAERFARILDGLA
jgi:hypothetical protein